jgi:hypothetical protein
MIQNQLHEKVKDDRKINDRKIPRTVFYFSVDNFSVDDAQPKVAHACSLPNRNTSRQRRPNANH